MGSTRALSDQTGTITDTYDYEAFGTLLNQTGTTDNDYLFAGEQFDSALDNYYLRARYYDPNTARFTQMDSWQGRNSDPVTLHKYLYANVDLVNNIDPSGQFSLGSVLSAINVAGRLAATATSTVLRTTATVTRNGAGRVVGGLRLFVGRVVAQANARGYTVKRIHLEGGPTGKSKFLKDINPNKFIAKALRSRKADITKNSEDSWKLVADVGKSIGTKGQSKVRVVFTSKGKIITAFPVK